MATSTSLLHNKATGNNFDFHLNWWFCIVSVAYLGFALAFSKLYGAPFDLYLLAFESIGITLTGFIFLFCARVIFVMAFIRPKRLIHYLLQDLHCYVTSARIRFSVPVLVLIPIFISAFGIFKAAIPFINPYFLDIKISNWDNLLHGGQDPWSLLQPIIGFPLVTMVINIFYHLWFFVMISFLYWQACRIENARLRMQFLWSFLLIWMVLGTIGATALSSVGPCYYAYFVSGDNPFAPLMQYLRQADVHYPIWALTVQDLLLSNYLNRNSNPALGISAMPSLHVATSVLMALVGWRVCRSAGIALTLFALIIMVGSVHLGWHYALDGYAGALGAWGIWQITGWVMCLMLKPDTFFVHPTEKPPEIVWRPSA